MAVKSLRAHRYALSFVRLTRFLARLMARPRVTLLTSDTLSIVGNTVNRPTRLWVAFGNKYLSSRHESHDSHISSGTLDYFLLTAFHALSLLLFPLLYFPPLQSAPAFSTLAFSTPALYSRIFHSRIFSAAVSVASDTQFGTEVFWYQFLVTNTTYSIFVPVYGTGFRCRFLVAVSWQGITSWFWHRNSCNIGGAAA